MASPLPSRSFASFAFASVIVSAIGVATLACGGPKYPSCENDDHCNTDGHKGVCVTGKCVECRTNDACGKGRTCKAGACESVEGYCDEKVKCPAGKGCKSNHCTEETVTSQPIAECDDSRPCKEAGARCQNGRCYAPPKAPGCEEFPSPKFAFESAEVTEETKKTLERLAKCMQGPLKGRKLLLTGHCDGRGEYEFNMGLGAERAEGIRKLITATGVPADAINTSSRGKLDANGTDEAGYANDRRVDIEVR